ncbi:hypothetical protein R6Q59_019566 [Mikania micrantha]
MSQGTTLLLIEFQQPFRFQIDFLSFSFTTGVKDYKLTYYTSEYETKDTDILAAFRVTPQPAVPPEEAWAAAAAESSTGAWTTVWTDGLTSLDRYKGRCYGIEPVPGEDNKHKLNRHKDYKGKNNNNLTQYIFTFQ